MDYLDLTDDFLKETEQTMSYDPNIPLQYRIIGKLNDNSDISTAKRFIEANKDVFQDKYSYLVLDSAVEMCLNIVIDENGGLGIVTYKDPFTFERMLDFVTSE